MGRLGSARIFRAAFGRDEREDVTTQGIAVDVPVTPNTGYDGSRSK